MFGVSVDLQKRDLMISVDSAVALRYDLTVEANSSSLVMARRTEIVAQMDGVECCG